jgi:hypothetical protein
MEATPVIGPRLAFRTERNRKPHNSTAARALVAEAGVVNRDIRADDFDPRPASRATLEVAVGHAMGLYPLLAVDAKVYKRAFLWRLHLTNVAKNQIQKGEIDMLKYEFKVVTNKAHSGGGNDVLLTAVPVEPTPTPPVAAAAAAPASSTAGKPATTTEPQKPEAQKHVATLPTEPFPTGSLSLRIAHADAGIFTIGSVIAVTIGA